MNILSWCLFSFAHWTTIRAWSGKYYCRILWYTSVTTQNVIGYPNLAWISGHIRHFKIEVSRQLQTSKCHVTSRLPSGLPFAVHVSTSGDLSCGKWFPAEFFCELIIENSCSKAQTCFFLMSFIFSNRVYALFPLHQNIFQAIVRLVRVERKTSMALL